MADADESSRTAMRQLAYYMDSELDCAVHVALPDGENGEDVADWLEEGVEPTAERVGSMLQPYEPDDDDRTEPPSEPPTPVDGDHRRQPSLRNARARGRWRRVPAVHWSDCGQEPRESLFLNRIRWARWPACHSGTALRTSTTWVPRQRGGSAIRCFWKPTKWARSILLASSGAALPS